MLLARKFCLVFVTVMASGNPLFQVSCAEAVLAVSYGLHTRYHRFVNPKAQNVALSGVSHVSRGGGEGEGDSSGVETSRRRRRSSLVALQESVAGAAAEAASEVVKLLDFNTMETVLLCCSFGVLLSGMVFESSRFAAGSVGYVSVSALVALLLVGSIGLFIGMLWVELRRSCATERASKRCRQATALTPMTARIAGLRQAQR